MSLEELRSGAAGPVEQALGALGLVAVFVALGGVYWDVTWHVVIGRESFWIAPHLLIYSGTAVFFFSVLGGFLLAWRRAGSLGAALASRTGAGFAVGALGSVVQVSAAPLDDLWHEMYGLDVTVWSPPHLMGVAGAMIGIYGLICALGTGLPRSERRGPTAAEVNVLLLFAAALALSMFVLAPMDFRLERRDPFFYPLLAGPLAAIPLVAAARYVGRFGAATVVALAYTLFRSMVVLIFVGMDAFQNPAPPVFLLAPALAVDLALLLGKKGGRGILPAAFLFGPALVFGEWVFRSLFNVPNWQPLEVAASIATVTVAAAAGALAGDRLQTLMRPDGDGV